jgi:hypothetical protein
MVAWVVTIEIHTDWVVREPRLYRLSLAGNVRQIIGDSAVELPGLIRELEGELEGPVLFYLDAHWGEHSPLLEELGAIATSGIKPVIVIHDFYNPLHPEYGFDEWDIGEYKLGLIEPLLVKIYGKSGWRHWFNEEASGEKRGVIYIEPVKEEE